MKSKQVKYVLPAVEVDMGGIPIKQALPYAHLQQLDPFLLLHHGQFSFNDHQPAIQQGIGPHPHKGFSPVTFVIDGEIHHRDSRGHNQIAKSGEVQWMHAGMGIVHSERPSQALVERKGRQEMIQLWINSPAANKMKIPTYQYLSDEAMPRFHSEDGKVKSKLVVGKYNDLSGTAESQSETLIIWSNAERGGIESYNVPEDHNVMIYLISGNAKIGDRNVPVERENLVIFDTSDSLISISAVDNAQWILLAGKPLEEEVTQYGPFVMNNQTEILEAMRDYQMGKMGILIEE